MSVAALGANDFDACEVTLQKLYISTFMRLGLARITVRTGASRGCDQVAAQTALEAGGRVELVLPWPSFEQQWVEGVINKYDHRVAVEVYEPRRHRDWTKSVARHRTPGPPLSKRVFQMFARCWGIVQPAEMVIALTLRSESGGTGQGLRIGRALGKVSLDIRKTPDREQLHYWIRGLPGMA